jgi:hypothetical protein
MKKVLGSLIVAAALVVGANASDKRSFGEIYTECGLGGIIGNAAGGDSTGNVLAVVTNITWDLGTTAISSNITSDSTCANTKVKTAALINEGYDKLEEEIALGSGEYIDALKKVSGDKLDTQNLREEFAYFAASSDYEKLSHYKKAEKLFDMVVK